jgi:hypothetical protein
MVWVAIQAAQRALRQLMLGWDPVIDLQVIQDSLIEDQPGWSFLSSPANNLQYSFQHLQQLAWRGSTSNPGLQAQGRWVPSNVARYLRQVAMFQPLLLLYIHFTGGMPGRATEIGTIRWCNTKYAERVCAPWASTSSSRIPESSAYYKQSLRR